MAIRQAVCLVLALVVSLPLAASMGVKGGDVVRVTQDESIGDDLIVGGKVVSMEGSVGSDLIAGAENVELLGRVGDSALVGGEKINLTGIDKVVWWE